MKNLSVLFALALICFGCEKNEDPLMLDRVTVRATRINMIYEVAISGGSGRYEASTDRPQIADVRIGTGNVLVIETRQEGDAVITVTDKRSGARVECSLTVKGAISNFKIVSVRYAVDAEVPEAIEAELETPPYPIGSIFVLIHAVDRDFAGRWIVKTDDGTEIISGTFNYEPTEYYLPVYALLPIENQISGNDRFSLDLGGEQVIYDRYSVRGKAPARANITQTHARFYEDLTEYYKTKYPDAGVNGVVRVQLCDYY